jgi:hypothetical protein
MLLTLLRGVVQPHFANPMCVRERECVRGEEIETGRERERGRGREMKIERERGEEVREGESERARERRRERLAPPQFARFGFRSIKEKKHFEQKFNFFLNATHATHATHKRVNFSLIEGGEGGRDRECGVCAEEREQQILVLEQESKRV